MQTRSPAVAGAFYPGDAEELRKREEDKKRRMEELEKIKQALGNQ